MAVHYGRVAIGATFVLSYCSHFSRFLAHFSIVSLRFVALFLGNSLGAIFCNPIMAGLADSYGAISAAQLLLRKSESSGSCCSVAAHFSLAVCSLFAHFQLAFCSFLLKLSLTLLVARFMLAFCSQVVCRSRSLGESVGSSSVISISIIISVIFNINIAEFVPFPLQLQTKTQGIMIHMAGVCLGQPWMTLRSRKFTLPLLVPITSCCFYRLRVILARFPVISRPFFPQIACGCRAVP